MSEVELISQTFSAMCRLMSLVIPVLQMDLLTSSRPFMYGYLPYRFQEIILNHENI